MPASDVLRAPNPFDETDEIMGCPVCKSVNDFARICDIPDCRQRASGGHPMPDGGYAFRCWKHSPHNKDFVASAIEARSAETVGLRPQDESAVPQADAQTPFDHIGGLSLSDLYKDDDK